VFETYREMIAMNEYKNIHLGGNNGMLIH